MDIMLERILSLIPRKPDGKYVHGAKKDFCNSIGAPTNIVSEWEAGKTKSYRNYIHAIAMKYDVSVEWLKGEADDQQKKPTGSEASGLRGIGYDLLTPENKEVIDALIEKLLKSQSVE